MQPEKIKILPFLILLSMAVMMIPGCSGSHQAAPQVVPPNPSDDIALQHFLEGCVFDQKDDYANAILEYQYALRYKKDAAIYNAIAKDYSILGKHDLAMEAGKEAVTLQPGNRSYHEALADVYINAIELDAAINEYAEVIRIDSSYVEGWMSLARLQGVKDPSRALETYKRILYRFGPNATVYFQMAQIYSSSNNIPGAIESLKGMLAADPGDFEIRKSLGDTYLREDSADAALAIYNELAELHPESLELRASIAHAYLVKQDYHDAERQFDEVLHRDSLTADDQLRFGQIFVAFIQKDSAVAPYALRLFEKISTSYPDDWRPYWFLGAIDNVLHDDSSALQHFGKVRDLARWNPDGWVGVASVYYDRNQFDEAVRVLNDAKAIIPNEFRIYFLLGISLQRMNKPVDAASTLERALQLNEKSVDAMTSLGLVYDELKRHDESDSMYERAIRLDPTNHLLLNNYGYSLAERNIQLDRALAMSREAVRQQPTNQSYLDTYGWVYYRRGEYEEAERYIRKAIELGSTSPVIHEHMGDVYFKLAQKDKAMEYWKKAFELDTTNLELKAKIERGSL
jgi:tetratricopeptide (TPR) repeat protein